MALEFIRLTRAGKTPFLMASGEVLRSPHLRLHVFQLI